MEEHIHILIAKALNDEATGAELRELDMWVQESEENRLAYESMQQLWQQADRLWEQPQFDETAAWNKVSAAMLATETAPQSRVQPLAPRRAWWRVSAAAAAIIAVVLAYNIWSGEKMVTVEAKEQLMAVTLPDHSQVSLRKGSTLRYPEHFDKNSRKVSLSGEAYFEVTHKEEQPFIVESEAVSVTVLGTTFYVSDHGHNAQVTVTSGKVRMAVNSAPQNKLILLPGNKGVYSDSDHKLRTEADTNAVFYRSGHITFTGQPLEQVLAVIGKIKSTPLSLSPAMPQAAAAQAINASFGDQPLEEILDELCMITRTRWSKTGKGYELYPR